MGTERGSATGIREHNNGISSGVRACQPNIGLQATAYSLRSYVAAASGGA